MAKGKMTAGEAGSLGGKKTVEKYGAAHFRKIAKKGGEMSTTKFKAGDPRVKEIARKGGLASGGNFKAGTEHARECGRIGGKKKEANRRTREEE